MRVGYYDSGNYIGKFECVIPAGCIDNDLDYHFEIFGGCPIGDDCNDNDVNINPSKSEICGNSIDENCDGLTPACAPIVPLGYIAWWRLEGNTNDETGNYDGTFVGTNKSYVERKTRDYAINFDGDIDYVETGKNDLITNKSEFTLSVWAKSTENDVSGNDFVFYQVSVLQLRKLDANTFYLLLTNSTGNSVAVGSVAYPILAGII